MRVGGAAAGAVVLALGAAGCAAPEYTYVGDSGHHLVLRVPRAWTAMDTGEVLEASGVDPATVTDWAVFYDAATRPDPAHVQADTTRAPLLLARTIDVPDDERDDVTQAGLREQLLPADATQRAAAAEDGTFRLITDQAVDDERGLGARVVYSFRLTSGPTEYVDQIALTDPDHTTISLVYVHCDEPCYRERATEIGSTVTSLTLKHL